MPLPPPPQTLVRQDIWKLTSDADPWDPYSLAYAKAVAKMQALGLDTATSWEYQAAIHGRYDDNPQPDWNMCQHGTWYFLPWHRMYIYMFERIIRANLDADDPQDWALPYWNWTANRVLPAPFRQQQLPNGDDNPLFVQQRNPDVNAGGIFPRLTVDPDYALSFTNFSVEQQISPVSHQQDTGFGGGDTHGERHRASGIGTGGLEDQPHNGLHDLIGGGGFGQCEGGLMSDPNCAALDPIFWLHHSNIDRLWSRWLDKGGARVNPTDPDWTGHVFNFFDENGSQQSASCGEVGHTSQLDYRYDDDPPPVARPFLSLAPPRLPQPDDREPVERGRDVMVLGEITNVTLTRQRATETMPLGDQAREVIDALRSGDPSEARGLHLTIEGIKIEHNPGFVYGIYLNKADADEYTGHQDIHYAGMLTFFGAQHAGEHGPASRTFDVASLVHQMLAHDEWNDGEATLTFVPVGVRPPEGAEPAEPQHPVSDVTLERVTLTS